MKEFTSLADFSAFMAAAVPVTLIAEIQHGLERCATAIEKTARDEIGVYQPQVGPHPHWAELADSTENEKARLGFPTDAPLERTGELKESYTHEVGEFEALIGSPLDIAEFHEFGTLTIPPRPVLGPAAFRCQEKVEHLLGVAVMAGISGGQRIPASEGYDIVTGQ